MAIDPKNQLIDPANGLKVTSPEWIAWGKKNNPEHFAPGAMHPALSGSPITPQGSAQPSSGLSGSPVAPQGGVLAPNPYGGASMLNTIMGPATAPLYGSGSMLNTIMGPATQPLYGGGSMLNTIMGPATQPLYGGGFAAPGTGANPYAGKSYPAAAAAGNPYAPGGGGPGAGVYAPGGGGPGAGVYAPGGGGPGAGVTDANIKNNLSTGPDLKSISDLINTINLNAQQNANAARIPGAAGLEAKSSADINSALGGQLPQDVIDLLSTQAAERGTSMGSPGSPNANAALMRSLGLTSLGLMTQGQNWLTSALGRNPGAKIFDPTTQLLTADQAARLGIDQAGLGLEWYKLLNQGRGGNTTSGGGGGGSPTTSPASSGTYLDPRIAGQIFGTAPNPANPTSGTRTSGSYNDFGVPESDWNYLMGGSDVNPYTGIQDTAPISGYDPFSEYLPGE